MPPFQSGGIVVPASRHGTGAPVGTLLRDRSGSAGSSGRPGKFDGERVPDRPCCGSDHRTALLEEPTYGATEAAAVLPSAS